MDPTNLGFWEKILPYLGAGGIFALFTIWLLNKTWSDHTEVIKGFHEIERGRTDMLMRVVTENTTATTKNNVVLDALHRRLDRDEYNHHREEKS